MGSAHQNRDGDYRFAEKYLAGVASVSADEVQRVAKTYIKASLQTIGFLEPTQSEDKPRLPFGNGRSVRPN